MAGVSKAIPQLCGAREWCPGSGEVELTFLASKQRFGPGSMTGKQNGRMSRKQGQQIAVTDGRGGFVAGRDVAENKQR